jgi:hypothetical protein
MITNATEFHIPQVLNYMLDLHINLRSNCSYVQADPLHVVTLTQRIWVKAQNLMTDC